METYLQISVDGMNNAEMREFTDQAVNLIGREARVDARKAIGKTKTGSRGDAVTVGAVVLGLITSGTVVAFFEVIKSLIAREKKAKFTFKTPEGHEFSIDSKNLKDSEIEKARELFTTLIQKPSDE